MKHRKKSPFFDGFYLEYDVVTTYKSSADIQLKSKGTINRTTLTYRFDSIDDKYRVTKTEVDSSQRNLGEDIFTVDSQGKVEELNNYLEIWLPIKDLDVGDVFYGNFKTEKKEKWHDWDVSVLIDEFLQHRERYYDTETGYLAGLKATMGL